jgi:cobalamin biosynthesis protein CobT
MGIADFFSDIYDSVTSSFTTEAYADAPEEDKEEEGGEEGGEQKEEGGEEGGEEGDEEGGQEDAEEEEEEEEEEIEDIKPKLEAGKLTFQDLQQIFKASQSPSELASYSEHSVKLTFGLVQTVQNQPNAPATNTTLTNVLSE